MPTDYSAIEEEQESPPAVSWSRRSLSSRRLSNAAARRTTPAGILQQSWRAYISWSEWVVAKFWALTPLQRAGAVAVCVLGWALIILTLVYSHLFFAWLGPVAKSWRELRGGWLIAFALVFVTGFPPLIGYSTANTVAGFVFGVWPGWLIVASGCTIGSLCAFLASRTILSGYVDRMVGKDHRFVALGQVLRRDGIWYLTAIRFCPLPFSLSNGFLATIPSISPLAFAVSTALSTPKLLIHVFIGSRLAVLAEDGENMTAGDKAVNYIGMIVGGAVGLAVGLAIYRRTMDRAAELAREEGGADAAEQGEGGYDDTDATLLDPEDAAAVMDDDDMSMWETQGNDAWEAYDDDDEDNGKKNKPNGSGSEL